MSCCGPSFNEYKKKHEGLVFDEDKVGLTFQLSCFPENDDGVPPPCKPKYCPLSHDHPILNSIWMRNSIGRIGFTHFDTYRKFYHGLASWISIIALGMTIYGCCSLSTNDSVVRRTYWAAVDGRNFTSTGSAGSMYVGLRTFIYSDCTFVPGTEAYPVKCHEQSISYSSEQCTSGPLSSACEACSSVATSIWFAAVTNVFGLVLATNGAQVRMRRKADVPAQKLLGMVTDLMGAVTLAGSLLQFHTKCFANMQSTLDSHGGSFTRIWSGPGFICYATCAFAALIRAVVHWLTPISSLSDPPTEPDSKEADVAGGEKRADSSDKTPPASARDTWKDSKGSDVELPPRGSVDSVESAGATSSKPPFKHMQSPSASAGVAASAAV